MATTTKMSGTMTGSTGQARTGIKARKLSLNIAAKAKDYFLSKEQYVLGPRELDQAIQAQSDFINIIDVRQAADYARGHLPGAINLPRDQWKTVAGLKKDKLNVIYCYSLECPLAAQAAAVFAGQGYSVMEMAGGFEAWQDNDFKTDKQVHH